LVVHAEILAELPGGQGANHDVELGAAVAAAEYRKLVGQRTGFLEYLRSGESLEGVELVRDSSPARDMEL
jgi:hypothetical protein